jgi:PAP2 superfamily
VRNTREKITQISTDAARGAGFRVSGSETYCYTLVFLILGEEVSMLTVIGSLLWLLAALALVVSSLLRTQADKKRDDFVTAAGFVALSLAGKYLHWLIIRISPSTVDKYLLATDRRFGFDPTEFVRWTENHQMVFLLLGIAYLALPLAMAMAWIADQNHVLRNAVLIGGLVCWFFYAACPATGPWYYLAGMTSGAPRNCMPSMHLSWALMLAINARSRWRYGLSIYAGVLAVATIGLGEHYLIDLIAAVPFTLAVEWIALRLSQPASIQAVA